MRRDTTLGDLEICAATASLPSQAVIDAARVDAASEATFVSPPLRAGLVRVNGGDACAIAMPFGDFKQSGFGRDRSLHALHKYADLKAISITLR